MMKWKLLWIVTVSGEEGKIRLGREVGRKMVDCACGWLDMEGKEASMLFSRRLVEDCENGSRMALERRMQSSAQ
jgi:hypothetical protein